MIPTPVYSLITMNFSIEIIPERLKERNVLSMIMVTFVLIRYFKHRDYFHPILLETNEIRDSDFIQERERDR